MDVRSFTAGESDAGIRLDAFIATCLPSLSRSGASRLVRTGHITVNGLRKKPGYLMKAGDTVRSELPPLESPTCEPEPIPLSILHEDGDLIVISKPPGLVVHPGAGHNSGTLVNALLFHCPDLEGVGDALRPGIVHRLDKDTSGIMIIAKNDAAYKSLGHQFKTRQIRKIYLGLVYGETERSAGVINLPIGRHPTDRKKMSTHTTKGRHTVTTWKVLQQYNGFSLLEVSIQTGRTHQIRVHLASSHHPVVGDTVYGGKKVLSKRKNMTLKKQLGSLGRPFLHAQKLGFRHPEDDTYHEFVAPLPLELDNLLNLLKEEKCS